MAGSFAAAEDFAAKCVKRAGENPLFLEQLLRAAHDLVDGKLPTTVQSVVLARADLLASNDRRAIEAGFRAWPALCAFDAESSDRRPALRRRGAPAATRS